MRSLTRPLVTGLAIPDGSGVALLARIVGQLGTPITQASLSSITWAVTDLTAGVQLGTGTFTISSVVFNSLVTDPRWQIDTPFRPGADGKSGYNFLAVLPASLFPVQTPAPPDLLGGLPSPRIRQADVTFTPVTGEQFKLCLQWQQLQAWG